MTTEEVAINGGAEQPELKELERKYEEERNKRLRPEGQAQFLDTKTSKYHNLAEDPWVDQTKPTPPDPALEKGSHCKYLILGAGYGGLLVAVRAILAGIPVSDIRMLDSAAGFGGTCS